MILNKCKGLANAYKDNKRSIADKPIISLQIWRKAAQWLTDIKFVETFDCETSASFCVLTNKIQGDFNRDFVDKENQKVYKSFDKYKSNFGLFWTVNLNKISWETESLCNCRDFLKNYTCVHVVGLALNSRLCKLPKSAIPTKLAKKNTVGRRPKSTKALLVK